MALGKRQMQISQQEALAALSLAAQRLRGKSKDAAGPVTDDQARCVAILSALEQAGGAALVERTVRRLAAAAGHDEDAATLISEHALALLGGHLGAETNAELDRQQLAQLVEPSLPGFLKHRPTPKQAAFLLVDDREALYGGSAGGGKSDALLMLALQHVDVPNYASIIFRRSYADLALPDGLIPRSQQWLAGTGARWNDLKKQWLFPSGATLSFGYLEHENDKYRYQGSAFQCICWDELTQHSESSYSYLFSRLRRLEGSDAPLRVRAASNPGGVGHEWVRQRFLTEGMASGRPFLPARLYDNPYLDRDEYAEALARLDPVTRAQLLEGDWTARAEGGLFRREWFQAVDAAPRDLFTCRFWDLAATEAKPGADPDWTAGARLGIDQYGTIFVLDIRRLRGSPAQVEKFIRETAQLDGRDVMVYLEQEPGASGKSLVDYYRRRVLPEYSVQVLEAASRGSKRSLAGPFSSRAEAGYVRLVRGDWIGAFFDEAEAFPVGPHDDMVDAVCSAYLVASGSAFQIRASHNRASAGTRAYVERRLRECRVCRADLYPDLDAKVVACYRCGHRVDLTAADAP